MHFRVQQLSMEEKIVDAVREESVIYDKSHIFYKNKISRVNAWERISMKVGLDVHKCHIKWKSLRDQYVRKKSARRNPKKEWKFLKKLNFLEGHVAPKNSFSNVEHPEDSFHEWWNFNESSSTREKPSKLQIPKNDSGGLTSDLSLPSTSNNMKRRKSTDESENIAVLSMFCKELLDTVKFETNQYDMYFKSLAKIIAAKRPRSNLEFLDLQIRLASFLRDKLQNREEIY